MTPTIPAPQPKRGSGDRQTLVVGELSTPIVAEIERATYGAAPASAPIVQAADRAALCAALGQMDISVPARTAGRTTRHTETWTIARLLATLADAGRVAYPIAAYHRDKPDIALTSGGLEIGVEITEAISTQYAAYCALAEREFPDVFLEPAHFHWNAPPMSVEDMRALLRQSQLTSDGWAGDRPEQEWALFMCGAWETKLAKLQRPDFAKYARNWLAIYDNLPLPNIDLQTAVGFLRPSLQDFWTRIPAFDAIFIEHGPVIVALKADGVDHLVLKDLWD